MPGHIKKTEGPDPCPDQWLIVSDELKVKLKAKPYDPKKSCWVPNKATGGYNEGLIENIEGDKASVKILETGDVSIKIWLNSKSLEKADFGTNQYTAISKTTICDTWYRFPFLVQKGNLFLWWFLKNFQFLKS